MTNPKIEPYNGDIDHKTSLQLIERHLLSLKDHKSKADFLCHNDLQDLKYNLSKGKYILTKSDVVKIKNELMSIYGLMQEDDNQSCEDDIYRLIALLYTLNKIRTY